MPLAGDYNHNGIVDPTDYDVWKNNFGSSINLDADGNNNGIVDAADYVVWRHNVGAMLTGAAAAAAANVPEPGGLAIAVGAALGAMGFQVRRVQRRHNTARADRNVTGDTSN
jgi:glucose dehydrogenase